MKIVSYFNPEDKTGKEKGMISMASTIAPIAIFDTGYDTLNSNWYTDQIRIGKRFVSKLDISAIGEAVKKAPVIHVLYELDTFPTAADIESKFTESGVATVVLHEKKNFSHGRSTLLYNQDFAMVINLTRYGTAILPEKQEVVAVYKTDYDKIINNYLRNLCKEKSAYYLELGNQMLDVSACNIKEMVKLPYLITSIGKNLGVDISKPLKPYPSEVIPLYDYTGEF